VCRREVEVDKAACRDAQRGLQANLTACQHKGKEADAGRVAELEASSARFLEDQGAWQRERAQLLATLSACRPARAHTEARLREVLADGTIDTLETTAMWLQVSPCLSIPAPACPSQPLPVHPSPCLSIPPPPRHTPNSRPYPPLWHVRLQRTRSFVGRGLLAYGVRCRMGE